QPYQQFLMRGMRAVGFARGFVGEFHDAAQFISLATRRIVAANPRLQNAGNLVLQSSNRRDDFYFLFFRHSVLKPKRKHVDVHITLHRWTRVSSISPQLCYFCTAREQLLLSHPTSESQFL